MADRRVLIGGVAAVVGVGAWLFGPQIREWVLRLWYGDRSEIEERHVQACLDVVAKNAGLLEDDFEMWERRSNRLLAEEVARLRQSLHAQLHAIEAEEQEASGEGESLGESKVENGATSLTGPRANGYYFFNSKGERLRTKWEDFDVDAELARLDDENGSPAPGGDSSETAVATKALSDQLLRGAASVRGVAPTDASEAMVQAADVARRAVNDIVHDCEAQLTELTQLVGSTTTRQRRKAIASRLLSLVQQQGDPLLERLQRLHSEWRDTRNHIRRLPARRRLEWEQ